MSMPPQPWVVAFDIETLGLLHEVPLPEITCVCFHCEGTPPIGLAHSPEPLAGVRVRLWGLPEAERAVNVTRVVALLDSAEVIAGFNAILFDLEYISRAFRVAPGRARSWVLKCIDPYMCTRWILGEGCGMNYMLALNGLESKTGSGKDAVRMAREGEWPALLNYCYMDAKLTYDLCALPWLRLTPGVECCLNWGRSPPVFRLVGSTAENMESNHRRDSVGETMPLLQLLPVPDTHYSDPEDV
jgi:hypothetical protein